MKENSSTKTGKDIITPEIKSEIPLNAVKFKKSWTFWETYVSKTTDLSFENSNKLIFKWDDLITFFQFWNKYPGRDIKNILFDILNINFFTSEIFSQICFHFFYNIIIINCSSPYFNSKHNYFTSSKISFINKSYTINIISPR